MDKMAMRPASDRRDLFSESASQLGMNPRYDLAKPGSFRLSPPPSQVATLRRDYREMRDIFYREPPEFATILAALRRLEEEINNLK